MNLIIGNTSQLSYFFPNSFNKISSRNLNFKLLQKKYDTVYITFAEQRTFNKSLCEKDFLEVNVKYTSDIIDHFSIISNKVIVYGTAELWNNYNGEIDMNTKIDYKYSPYIKSKEILYETILNNRIKDKWNNVFIIHPFNFNSIHRKEGFLFHKIYDSLIRNVRHNVDCLDINRDIIHASYLVSKSLSCSEDIIVGSGKLTNIENFTYKIFLHYKKDYKDFLFQEGVDSKHKNNIFWLKTKDIYSDLLKNTIEEIDVYHKQVKIK